jgi:signal peptidase II
MTKPMGSKNARHGEEQPQAASRTTQRSALTAYGIAGAIIAADQISKHWVLEVFKLPLKREVEVLGPFHLSMVWNRGVSFGLFRAEVDWIRWALVGFSVAVAVFLAGWARKVERPLLAAAIGLVMGGAIGNVVDRIRFGAVADFIDFKALYFPWVFNVADSAISIGVLLLLLDSFRNEKRP